MAINNFKPFALDPNANVTSQADWEALPALLSGFTAGKASSAQVNKAIRQASFIAAALAQYTANKSRLDVLDDGDLNGFISKMGTAFGKDFQALDATLTALARLATGANKLPYFTGNDTAAQTDLTSVGRDIIGKNTIADILTYLGLGEAAKRNVGTGAKQIPDMSAYSSGSGWQKLPDGSIEQWGRINFPTNAAAVSTNVTFPIPFTQEPYVVIVYDGGFGGGNMWGATNWTRTGFVAHCNYGFEGGAFFAKGR
ncbi:phage tail protein [Escherichia coli]|nr:phage tail protein [Escherichia coli]